MPISHIVKITARIYDPVAVTAACQRLGLPVPIQGTAKLFSNQASGLIVQLTDWRYPVVIDTTKGEVAYDNFNGNWGEQSQLDRLIQLYSVEKTKLKARKKGHTVSEQLLQDGSIKVQITAA